MTLFVGYICWQLENDMELTPCFQYESTYIPVMEKDYEIILGAKVQLFPGGYTIQEKGHSSINEPGIIFYTKKNDKFYLNYSGTLSPEEVVQLLSRGSTGRVFLGGDIRYEVSSVSWRLDEHLELKPIVHFKGGFFTEKYSYAFLKNNDITIGTSLNSYTVFESVYQKPKKIILPPQKPLTWTMKEDRLFVTGVHGQGAIGCSGKVDPLRIIRSYVNRVATEPIIYCESVLEEEEEEAVDAKSMRTLALGKKEQITNDIISNAFLSIKETAEKGFLSVMIDFKVSNVSVVIKALEEKGYTINRYSGTVYNVSW